MLGQIYLLYYSFVFVKVDPLIVSIIIHKEELCSETAFGNIYKPVENQHFMKSTIRTS